MPQGVCVCVCKRQTDSVFVFVCRLVRSHLLAGLHQPAVLTSQEIGFQGPLLGRAQDATQTAATVKKHKRAEEGMLCCRDLSGLDSWRHRS